MTSKISLRKLIRIDAQQRSWLLAVMSVACALLLPVNLLMSMQSATRFFPGGAAGELSLRNVLEIKQEVLLGAIGPRNVFVILGVFVAAMLAAFSGYAYMHARNKVDFFHSLAIRREKLFLAPYLGGALFTVGPYILSVLVSMFVIGGANRLLSKEVIRIGLQTMGLSILSFFAIYSVLILGMMLAGRTITGVLLALLIISFGPICHTLIRGLCTMSFATYWGEGLSWAKASLLSPVTLMWRMTLQSQGGNGVSAVLLLVQAAYLVAGFALAIVFYKRRASETAENSLVHHRLQPFVKGAITIPAAIFTGIVFYGLQGTTIWLLVGAAISAFLMSWLLDAIFDRDIRSLLSHKLSGGIVIGMTVATLLFFITDPLGYDRFLPGTDKIEAMSLCCERGVPEWGDYYPQDPKGIQAFLDSSYTADFSPIYKLAEEGVSSTERRGFVPAEQYNSVLKYNGNSERIVIAYRMKNGKVEYRQYFVDSRSVASVVHALAEAETYRETSYPASFLAADDFVNCSVTDYAGLRMDSRELGLTASERAELLRCLREDAMSCSLRELSESSPLGSVDPGMYYDEESILYCFSLQIYPQFERTREFFMERDYDLFAPVESEEILSRLTKITVYGNEGSIDCVLEDPADIQAFLANFQIRRSAYADSEDSLPYVEFTHRDGTMFTFSGVFADPEVLRDIAERCAYDGESEW